MINIKKYTGKIKVLAESISDDEEDIKDVVKCLEEDTLKALTSYNGNFKDIRHCYKCGLPLIKGSVPYIEGYHFDSCI